MFIDPEVDAFGDLARDASPMLTEGPSMHHDRIGSQHFFGWWHLSARLCGNRSHVGCFDRPMKSLEL